MNKKAFSLIELSIVILIIGIIIVGAVQSSILIDQFRLSTARTLTASAPIHSVKNLIGWIDSTSEDSFDPSEQEDGTAITNWYNLNSQSTLEANFTQATSTQKPLYKRSIINNLPAIKFDGVDDFMSSANFPGIINNATVFMVLKTPAVLPSEIVTIFSKRSSSNELNGNIEGGYGNIIDADYWNIGDTTSGTEFSRNTNHSTAIINSTNYIISFVLAENRSNGRRIYENGTNVLSEITSNSNAKNQNEPLYIGKRPIGSAYFFSGHLAEFVMFDRAIKDKERISIEDYLSKKWNIAVSR